ncbi:MAG: hypothetical protein K2P94_15575 [Rhodospirillaceae bacterium]|nr:hypothetical protein [Rhodospirillaceae bacterium]
MKTMNLTLSVSAAILLCAMLAACTHPPEVRSTTLLTMEHLARLKQEEADFTANANAARQAQEQMIAQWQAEIRQMREPVESQLDILRLQSNTQAVAAFKALREDDEGLRKNPFFIAGMEGAESVLEPAKFGRISASSESQFDGAIKGLSDFLKHTSKPKDLKNSLDSAKDVFEAVKEREKKEADDAAETP